MVTLAARHRMTARDDGFFLGGAIAPWRSWSRPDARFNWPWDGRASPHRRSCTLTPSSSWAGSPSICLQNIFAATGRTTLHRRLGWLATGWIVAMLALGCIVRVAMVRRRQVPISFPTAAIPDLRSPDLVRLRRADGRGDPAAAPDRLASAFAFLRHVAVAWTSAWPEKLLPMPLLVPWAWEADMAACLIFPHGRPDMGRAAHRPGPSGLVLGAGRNGRMPAADRGDHLQPPRRAPCIARLPPARRAPSVGAHRLPSAPPGGH